MDFTKCHIVVQSYLMSIRYGNSSKPSLEGKEWQNEKPCWQGWFFMQAWFLHLYGKVS